MRTSDLEDLGGVAGYRATRILAIWYAGKLLHVPTQAAPGHWLETLIGAPAIGALVREFAGERFTIPHVASEEAYRRDMQIAERFAAGRSVGDVAVEFGLSPRRVEQLRAGLADRGWLRYAQGFDTAMARGKARRDPGPLPEFLGTGGVFG